MRDRTADLLRAKQALSQLSYSPISFWLFCRISLLCCASSLSDILMYVPLLITCTPRTAPKSLKNTCKVNLVQARRIGRTFTSVNDDRYNAASTRLVGLSGLEPPTLRLSGVRSNHLSYRPTTYCFRSSSIKQSV